MIRITHVTAQPGFKLFLTFEDVTKGTVDLSESIRKGVFKKLGDPDVFAAVYVDSETGAIAWSDQLDLCPDSLYLQITGKTLDEFCTQMTPDHANH